MLAESAIGVTEDIILTSYLAILLQYTNKKEIHVVVKSPNIHHFISFLLLEKLDFREITGREESFGNLEIGN